jgi:hypothetical protein
LRFEDDASLEAQASAIQWREEMVGWGSSWRANALAQGPWAGPELSRRKAQSRLRLAAI